MRWEKLYPLVTKVDRTYDRERGEIEAFLRFVEEGDLIVASVRPIGIVRLPGAGTWPSNALS